MLLAFASLLLGIGIGSVFISPADILGILKSYLCKTPLPDGIEPLFYGMVTGIRLPRVMMAFFAGAALSVSGTVMQSVLKNPLASSFGLGVSSGAGLGAALIMISGLTLGAGGSYLTPAAGTLFGFLAVILAIRLAEKLDKSLSNQTIILAGMVLSCFFSALTNLLAASNSKYTHQILLWQLGSFSGRGWREIAIVAVVTLICILIFQRHNRELDIMTFGEEQALSLGIDLKREKWILIGITAFLTGTAVSFVGVIGFVDLIAPHIVRRFFGASHKWVLPMSAVFGGAFMVLCDLAGRVLAAPNEIPAGSITALIGAPFFLYIYFVSRNTKGGLS